MPDSGAHSGTHATPSGKLGFLTHKLGPLPVWAYALIVVGAYYWYTKYGPGAASTAAATAAGASTDPSTGIDYAAELAAANQQLADQANAANGTGNDLNAGGGATGTGTTPTPDPGTGTTPPDPGTGTTPTPDPGSTSPPPVVKHQESFFAKAKADLIRAGNKNPTLREIELKRNELRKKAGDKPLPVVAKKPITKRKPPVKRKGGVNPGGPIIRAPKPRPRPVKPVPVHKPEPHRARKAA